MTLRYRSMLAAIANGVRIQRITPQHGRDLAEIFQRHDRGGWPITMAHHEAVERGLLRPIRQGVTPE